MSPLMKSIDEFYKYYQEQIKIKSSKTRRAPYFIHRKDLMKKLILTLIISVFLYILNEDNQKLTEEQVGKVAFNFCWTQMRFMGI